MSQETSYRCLACGYASGQLCYFARFESHRATICKWCLDSYRAHRDSLQRHPKPPPERWDASLLTPVHVPSEHVYPFARQ